MKFALVFPGQGSQSVGMMNAYGDSPVIRATFDEASAALGRDLWQLAAEGPAEALSQTVNTQPLMLTAGIAAWRLWLEKGGALPTMVAGHSLGEYSALVAADVLSLKDAVPLVELRAKAMQEAVPAGTGAMAAILGLDVEAIKAVCAESAQGEVVQAVNFNAPEQTVIAGHAAAVQRAADACKAKGAKRAVMLPVSAPFHCSLMQPAAERLKERLAALDFSAPSIPVVNNVDVAAVSDPAGIKDALVRQAAAPVRWVEIMRAMQAAGVSHVYECGPGKVLAGVTKRCADGLVGGAMADLAGIEAALAAVAG
ncbi:ACP S-malonyltransferase [Denitratisoma oestradiolicum]|uniref:Malonyl CoA-acyl carrier protein transacylase n=1 Tax=Denitratisoma oestradiolicum TaxID=311182 RepID=A0A6S6XWX9_9PROT|nr:ACP S-malonyltransferase [Denitratisoma oestradiolicum]TWO80284.1 [acyl-carrier-protein] S-malonyltransferase [Denitratisoma oestradiolicum]CAB1369379.1 malonyl-CoA-[acyl-carrier-protein] transacylase [Denitratisoma oestradiolicum]